MMTFCYACSYAMRYIAKVLKNSLHEKFPEASGDDVLKVFVLNMFTISKGEIYLFIYVLMQPIFFF